MNVVSEKRLLSKAFIRAIGITNIADVNDCYKNMSQHGINTLVLQMVNIINAIPSKLTGRMQDNLIDVTVACLNSVNPSSSNDDKIFNDANEAEEKMTDTLPEVLSDDEQGESTSEYQPSESGKTLAIAAPLK